MRRRVGSVTMWLVVLLGLTAAYAWAGEPPARPAAPRLLSAAELNLCAAVHNGATPDEWRYIENQGDVRDELRVAVATGNPYFLITACERIGL